MKLSTHQFSSPAGKLLAAVDSERALVRLEFVGEDSRELLEQNLEDHGHDVRSNRAACAEVERQLRQYFRGERREFELDLAPEGTDFQHSVWDAVEGVSFGRTATYAEIARRVGSPRAVRAVGRCNATNPIVIVVPCHRIVGSDGSLTGYGGGLAVKQALLELEGVDYSTRIVSKSPS